MDHKFTSRSPIAAFLACVSVLALLWGCSTHQRDRAKEPSVPSTCSLVLPSGEMRMVQVMAGLPEAGADYGPFSGRRDARLGTRQQPFERIDDGYERRIFDRQFTSVGRPFNIYQDTTYAIKRISR